ncbi:mitochondrial import protein Pam17-domain-containing protein [Pseudoneurospora amorphoporcata]|uniref:Presequence translocated-associated motor subunit PAM17 n=1 Tax=Pseudoneurospora amorphoporcata TaxID=241081 RepID=A0AAN6NSU2_9PEZI|nr:mitochondrial import protein Pam17-domain-containing protein [Pseudoneurospora amorphoporcata]
MLSSTATTMLRAGVSRSPGALQPMFLRTAACTCSPFSMNTIKLQQPTTSARHLSTTPSALVFRFRGAQQQAQQQLRRASSSSSSSTSTRPRSDAELDADAAEAAAAAQAAAHAGEPVLDWNTFFKLRKTRRRVQLVFSVIMTLVTSGAGGAVLSTGVADSMVSQVPLEPMFAIGLMTASFGALGWLMGPGIGGMVFNAMKSKYRGQMAIKEGQFFARIKKHRVDPSASSMGNPVPDFYGEKISSVAGYRQWLKDQRAFNKKRTTFV